MKNLNTLSTVGFILLAANSNMTYGALSPRVYVANEEEGTISVINPRTNRVEATIDTMKSHGSEMEMFMPHNVQVAPNGKTVWVTAPPMETMNKDVGLSDEVIVISSKTNKIVRRIPLGKDLHLAHVVLDGESRYAFVTAFKGDAVFRIDAKTYKVIDTYRLSEGSGPHGARLCGGLLFVAELDGNALAVIDTQTGAITEIPVGGKAVQAACTKDGKFAFATLYDTREVVRYDIHDKSVTRISLPEGSQGPVQLYLSPSDENIVY
ncbi:MAG: YncE family protein, partial [Bdellovibrionota bacterium]